VLTPDAEGLLRSERACVTAFMAPRLQGEHHPEGWLELSLWGAGALGRLRFTPLQGPFRYGPNRVENDRGEGLFTAQSAPVALLRGARAIRFTPAARCAAWDPGRAEAAVERTASGRIWRLPWACAALEQRGDDLVLAAGADAAELVRGLALAAERIVAEHRAHAAACDRLPEAGPFLRSLVRFGAHAAMASVRAGADGAFAGLAAGPAYSAPARSYYRDGYWTLPMLLQVRPAAARAWVDALAAGVRPDGEAPSAVLTGGPEQVRRFAAVAGPAHVRPGEWWSDHFDSPLYFVLAVAEVAAATGDETAIEAWWEKLTAVFERYAALAEAGEGLPPKPRHDRDWADNVFRSGAVAYDLGLWVGAADAMARMAEGREPRLAARARAAGAAARAGLERLWRPEGWYADYLAIDGGREDHLALDTLTLLRFDAVTAARARGVLDAVHARLEAPWGVRCVDGPYRRRADLRAKSAFAGRYHNGGDWPWLDGLYASERLRRGLPGWEHGLTAWWRTGLARGWTSPVEHHSPAFGRGSLLQAWSSLPAAAALRHAEEVMRSSLTQ
jgi:hypothetical protein